jgi:hypothetical protein
VFTVLGRREEKENIQFKTHPFTFLAVTVIKMKGLKESSISVPGPSLGPFNMF